MTTNLYQSIRDVFGDDEFIAGDVVKQSKCVARKEQRNLKAALVEQFGQKITGRKVGHWLNKNITLVPADLKLTVVEDRRRCQKLYCLFKPAIIEEIEAELDVWEKEFMAKRQHEMAGKDLTQQIKRIERDSRKLSETNAQREKFAAKKAKREDRALEKKMNVQAQQDIAQAEKEAAAKPAKTNYFLAPACGFFTREDIAEKRCKHLIELGFDAGLSYLSASHCQISVTGEFDLDELRRVALKFYLTVHETTTPAQSDKHAATEAAWQSRYSAIGYNPDARYLNRSADPSHRRVRGAMQSLCRFRLANFLSPA